MNKGDLFGHPRGLTILFFTETWAHFSFYGMQALLIYYLTKHLDFSQPDASLVYGAYAGFAHLTGLIGGPAADRWLGQRRAVIAGSLIMALGHFALIWEAALFPALFLVGLGNGLFMTSTVTQVGLLYDRNDARKDAGYNLYYVGINIGAFLAPVVCGTLGEVVGWHYGFAAAGVGMLIGLTIYLLNQKHVRLELLQSQEDAASAPRVEHWRAIRLLALVAGLVILFRITNEQGGNALALWADQNTNRQINDFVVPATWFQSLNPLLVFTLAPLLSLHWTRQTQRGRGSSTLTKMAVGCALMACAHAVMLLAAAVYGNDALVPMIWTIAYFLLATLAELYVLPIGLSLFGKLSPPRLVSTLIGFWYFAKFVASLVAGWMAGLWSAAGPANFFALQVALAAAAALCMLIAQRVARRRALPI